MYRHRAIGNRARSAAALSAAVVAGLFCVVPLANHLDIRHSRWALGDASMTTSIPRPVAILPSDGSTVVVSPLPVETIELSESAATPRDPFPFKPEIVMPRLDPWDPGPQILRAIDFDLADLDSTPLLVHRSAPEYPQRLLDLGVEGRVVLTFRVDEAGRVVDVVVSEATHPEFAEAARRAVLGWRFMPGTIGGRAVRFRMVQPITFRLVNTPPTRGYRVAASDR